MPYIPLVIWFGNQVNMFEYQPTLNDALPYFYWPLFLQSYRRYRKFSYQIVYQLMDVVFISESPYLK